MLKKIKLMTHLMPWEINSFKGVMEKITYHYKKHPEVDIHQHIDLNLNTKTINWDMSQKSQLECSSEFLEYFSNLPFDCTTLSIIHTDKAYGSCDMWANSGYAYGYDGFVGLAPDIDFNLNYINIFTDLISKIPNKYYTLAPLYGGAKSGETLNTYNTTDFSRHMIFGWFDYYTSDFLKLVGMPYSDGVWPIDYYWEHCMIQWCKLHPEIDYAHYVIDTNINEDRTLIDEDRKLFSYDREFVINQSKSRDRTEELIKERMKQLTTGVGDFPIK
jgi:hypothetical protein